MGIFSGLKEGMRQIGHGFADIAEGWADFGRSPQESLKQLRDADLGISLDTPFSSTNDSQASILDTVRSARETLVRRSNSTSN